MFKRPLCIATIFYIIGIIIGLYLSVSIALFGVICFIIALISYLITSKKYIIILILILFIGATYIRLIDINYANKYDLINENKDLTVKVLIISEPKKREYKSIYEVKIVEVKDEHYKKYEGTHWLLNVKKSVKVEGTALLEYGDMIEITAIFEEPNEARNYKGFDYKQYLKTQKIYGNITAKETIKIIEHNSGNIMEKTLYSISKDMKSKIYQILPTEVKELCIGILIGERGDISEQITNVFKESSLTHMLAVSGAHISYIVLGLSLILKKTGKRIQKIFTIIFLLFFMGLTKFTPSVERASIMAILTIIGGLIHRQADVYNNLACSALIILIVNPYTLLDIGFQLSYAGTIGIVVFDKKISNCIKLKIKFIKCKEIQEKKARTDANKNIKLKGLKRIIEFIIDLFVLTISANLMIIPIMEVQFNTVSLTFWISNILAGPFIGIITVLGFIIYIVSIFSINLANVIAIPLDLLLQLLIKIAKIGAILPLSSISIETPNTIEIISYYAVIFICIFFQEIKNKLHNNVKKIIIVILIVNLIINLCYNNSVKNLRIYFVDVGQGDCTLICTPNNKTILIDGGGSENSDGFDVGEKILSPYLLDRRIKKIDYVMISHFDSDHVGGLFYILEHLKVKNIIISKQAEISKNYLNLKSIVEKKKINIIIARRGNRLQIDKDIYFDILFPEKEMILENVLNNNSIVAKLVYKDFSMLFTGDIEKETEREILKLYNDNLNVLRTTVLKVPHHGSNSSSTDEFVRLIQPRIALIGVGNKNLYRHPNNEVIERLEKLRCKNL